VNNDTGQWQHRKIIFNGLVRAHQFKLTAVSRSSREAAFPAGVKVHKSDFSEAELVSAFMGQDVVILLWGWVDLAAGEARRCRCWRWCEAVSRIRGFLKHTESCCSPALAIISAEEVSA
jgi:hypothetical protein